MKAVYTIALLFLTSIASATNYYFSGSGNDAYSSLQAQNPATPWKSLQKLNNILPGLAGSDSVFFKRGETFRGAIIVSASGSAGRPIVFTAFGEGSDPVITGFVPLTGWSNTGNRIWEASVGGSTTTINNVLLNGEVQPLGRFPNRSAAGEGYLRYESFSGSSAITDQELPGTPNWNGGEVVIRKNRWVLDRNLITQHNGTTLQYQSETDYQGSVNYGYFIQNHRNTLDSHGEWYHNAGAGKVGVYLSGTDASAYGIEGSLVQHLVSVEDRRNISFKHLTFTGSNISTFTIKNASGISITDCSIRFSGTNAVSASNSNDLILSRNSIVQANNIALLVENCSNTSLQNNVIKNTGTVPGMGRGNSGSYEAILISGNNNTIAFNSIENTGYVPITFSGNSVTVKNNFISNFAFVKDDGGGIYTWNNSTNATENWGRQITGNIIQKGVGAGSGTDNPGQAQVHGIYIDDNSDHVIIGGNTVSDCAGTGIFLHNAHDIDLRANTVFNNSRQLLMEHDNIAPNKTIRNIRSFGNILFSKTAGQPVAEYKTKNNDLIDFGTFDSNYYCRPADDNLVIKLLYQVNGNYSAPAYDLDGWKTAYGKDLHSTKTPQSIPPFSVTSIIGNNQYGNGAFDANINGLYAYAAGGNSSTSWANEAGLEGGALKIAFSSTTSPGAKASVIIGAGAVTAGKKYVLKFSMKGGSDPKTMEAFIRKSLSPYNDLTERIGASIKNNRTEHEFLFTPTASETDASIVFDVPEQAAALFIDNIKFYEVTAVLTNPDDYIRFESNPTQSPKVIPLDGTYVDARNASYSGSITLTPYSSTILVKKNGQPEADNTPPTVDAGAAVSIFLPASTASLQGTAADANGSISAYRWTRISGPDQYAFADSTKAVTEIQKLVAGNYLFRLTATDNQGASAYDDVVVVVGAAVTSATDIPGRVEAEAWSSMSGVAVESTSDVGGGQNVGWIDAGDWMEYTVNAATAGTYVVNLRAAAYHSGAQVQIRNAAGDLLNTVNVTGTGGYQIWADVSTSITLPAGVQKLRVVSGNSVNWNLNWIGFQSQHSAPPAVTQRIEAEHWTDMQGVQTEGTSDADGGLNVGWIDRNDWMSYSIVPATAGFYRLSLRVATPIGGAEVEIKDAAGRSLNTIVIPNTGAWQQWQTVTAVIYLPASNGLLGLRSMNDASWNINWLQLTPENNPATTKIEAENYSQMQGIQTEGTSDAAGGLNVGWIDEGDWMDYPFSALQAGSYKVDLRIASTVAGGTLEMRRADGTVLSSVSLPNTNGFQNWTTVSTYINLPAGTQSIRIVSTGKVNWNINWLELLLLPKEINVVVQKESSVLQLRGVDSEGVKPSLNIYPNPAQQYLTITLPEAVPNTKAKIEVYSLSGVPVLLTEAAPLAAAFRLNISHLASGMYIVRVKRGKNTFETRFLKE